MKTGYRICIEKSLTAAQKKVAYEAISNFITEMTKDHYYIKGRGGYHSYFGVGRLGWGWGGLKEEGLLLRRVSKGRRIFAVMRAEHLRWKFSFKDEMDVLKGCLCPRGHMTSDEGTIGKDRYVNSSLPYSLQAFHTVHECGDIKG